jgi:hypothetical protein
VSHAAWLISTCVMCGWLFAGCSSPNPKREPTPPNPPVAPRPPVQPREPVPPRSPNPPKAPQPLANAAELAFKDLFPGVRADLVKRVVEVDAKTSELLFDDPKAPLFFVETLACAPDTREHESLLVTDVKASHLHAALLAIGVEAGAPGHFEFVNGGFTPVDAKGAALAVEMVIPSGESVDPRQWLMNVADRGKPEPWRFGSDSEDAGKTWVFAGSSMRKVTDKAGATSQVYDADGTGVIIGLCCFGSEVIAWERTFSPEASIDEPEWVADFSRTPPAGTPVRVRIRPFAK